MSNTEKWINEVQLMRKEHEADLEKERKRSAILLEALTKFRDRWEAYNKKQRELLVEGQDLESASKNWDNFPECFSFDFSPLFEALRKYEEMK